MNKNIEIDSSKVIQYMIDKCNESEGTVSFPERVQLLKDFIIIETSDYKIRIAINEQIKQLKTKYKNKIVEFIKNNPDIWFHPGKRIINEATLDEEYSKEVIMFLTKGDFL